MKEKKILDKAFALSFKGHFGKMRKDGRTPYVEHPKAVARMLMAWGVDDSEAIAAAYCHDLVEDTWVTLDDISAELGQGVSDMVSVLTKRDTVSKDEYVRSVALCGDVRCVLIKAADRICNTIDFVSLGEREYALDYFHAASEVFMRLFRERKRLGKIYDGFSDDMRRVLSMASD